MTPETITLEDPTGATRAQVLPELGFNCYSLRMGAGGEPVELLWSDPEFAGGAKRPTRSGIPILFPFAGRIGGTTFDYAGRSYTLEPGDDFGNAIHGFVVHRPWRVVERSADSLTGEFHAARDDRALLARWPADFCIRVTYRVRPGVLRAQIVLENPDRAPLPCGLGLHGYYRVPLARSGSGARCVVRVPVGKRWELANMLPTGKCVPAEVARELGDGVEIGQRQFDDVFQSTLDAHGTCTTSVADPASRQSVTMQFDKLFEQCVVFNPPHREAICIEPYTTVPDAFALIARGVDPHLLTIAPGGRLATWFEIRLEARGA